MRRTTILLVVGLLALAACTEQTFVKKDVGTEDTATGDTADVLPEGTGPGDTDVVEPGTDAVPDPGADGTEPSPELDASEEIDADVADPNDVADLPDTGETLDTDPPPEVVPEVVEDALPETHDAEIVEVEETEETDTVTPPSVLDHVGWFGGAPPATAGPIEHVGSFGMRGGGLLP